MIISFKAQYITVIQKYAKIFNQFIVAISRKKIYGPLKWIIGAFERIL